MKIKFEKEKDSILNTLFLKLTYMSGDADAYEYVEVEIEGVNYLNYKENIDKIKAEIKKYKIIAKLTDSQDTWDYEKIEKKYGEEIANLYQEGPGDSTCDHQYRAVLSEIELHAYNEKGELLISYI